MRLKIIYCALAAAPVMLLAFSTGMPIKRTGAPIDGALSCSACHTSFALNSDPRGSVTIENTSYNPGVTQTIKVTVKHPEATRWGFQLTARAVNDLSKQAGTFTPNNSVATRCDTTPVSDAPCQGTLEFAEHKDAPRTSAGAGFTFAFDWTPPSTEVGAITLYVAGAAANGDGTEFGDRIYTTSKTLPLSSDAACTITTKPVLGKVQNGASFQESLAPSSMLSIFGSGFQVSGLKRSAGAGDYVNGAFPKQLACIAVEIDGQRAPISYVDSTQINVQAPASAKTGPVTVRIIANPDRGNQLVSDVGTVQFQSVAPAFFTFPDAKSIAALFPDYSYLASPAVVAGGKPAKPGDVISLYATGLGPTKPPLQAGDLASGSETIANPFTVSIGGVTIPATDVLYAGLSFGSISGLYQLNVRIPASAPDGDVPVVIQMNGISSQPGATIAVKRP